MIGTRQGKSTINTYPCVRSFTWNPISIFSKRVELQIKQGNHKITISNY